MALADAKRPTAVFSYYPLYGWIYSFFNYRPPIKLSDSEFVGLKWFTSLMETDVKRRQLLGVLRNTFAMSGLTILTSWLPMAFAIFLTEIRSKRFKKSVQTLTTLPNFVSWVLVYSMAFALFSSSGMMNTLLMKLGIVEQPIQFLQSDSHTWLSMWLWSTWKSLGWSAIMYLAAIAGISDDLYEAARVDGAGRFRLIWNITIPQLIPTFFVLLLMVFFGAFTLICIYPFYYLIINTISANNLSANGEILFFSKQIHLQNYIDVIQLPGLLNAAFVTLARTVLGTVGTLMGSAFLGFMFTQEKMWARKFWYRFVMVTMYFNAGLIPWFLTMNNLGLTNNFLAYVVPTIVQPFNIILVKTYIENIPRELQEAAEIDGAGILRVFWQVMLPIVKPILAAITIFAAVGQWNSFQDTLLLMTNEKLFTLQFILYRYINQASSLSALIKNTSSTQMLQSLATAQTATSVRMTVSVIVVIPILCVYPFFQKYIVKGVMIGSVKG